MSKDSKAKTTLTVELIRRGGVMLKEPCQVCNGIQVRYKGKVYCTNHDDLQTALYAVEVNYEDVASSLRRSVLIKLKESLSLLEKESDPIKQDSLTSLMLKYVELLNRLPERPQ
jgi:uncharacterized Zn finger protein (UPF0148 family)